MSSAQVIIQGHHIGEDAAELLQAEPAIQARISACNSAKPRPITVEEVQKVKISDKKRQLELAREGNLLIPCGAGMRQRGWGRAGGITVCG